MPRESVLQRQDRDGEGKGSRPPACPPLAPPLPVCSSSLLPAVSHRLFDQAILRPDAAARASMAEVEAPTEVTMDQGGEYVGDAPPGCRLMIRKMVLTNFKSYANSITVGPFDRNMTSVVGPNGNGKSNVIDAMLFVFGFKAKKCAAGSRSPPRCWRFCPLSLCSRVSRRCRCCYGCGCSRSAVALCGLRLRAGRHRTRPRAVGRGRSAHRLVVKEMPLHDTPRRPWAGQPARSPRRPAAARRLQPPPAAASRHMISGSC